MNDLSVFKLPRQPDHEASADYVRIEKAILFLKEHFLEQPDLAAVAQTVHLSDCHFQRLFTRWAGISPKRFIQLLTLEYAKRQLAASKPILETALDSGLSSPGRLHDLFVAAEAVSPGEFKTRGAGIRIDYGFHPSPFGLCLAGLTARGLCWLSFCEENGQTTAVEEMKRRWSGAEFHEDSSKITPLVERIFSGTQHRNTPALPLLLIGTNFQIQVWRALLRIPPGGLVCYQTLGQWLGIPKACRAIGSAVGQNPISYLIPCHRVIQKSGVLGNYHWGTARKRSLLAWEASQYKNRTPA